MHLILHQNTGSPNAEQENNGTMCQLIYCVSYFIFLNKNQK